MSASDQSCFGTACPKCGRAMPPAPPGDSSRGLCPKCLLSALLAKAGEGEDEPSPLAGVLSGALQQIRVAEASPLELPRIFGGYELVEEIARGGMGIVYRARQLSVGRSVAIKVLAAGHFASPDFVRRFRTEAEAVANLDHPNIVPTYEVGEQDGHPFFSMKLVEGGSLADRSADPKSPMPARDAATLLAKLARAVHYAHQRGILHRDIKPGNVLLDTQGEPYLTDFGLAKLVEKDSTVTRTMAMLGTPSYMSPEQARGEARELTTAVDVYGLGAVFYELLTGQPPFAGGTTMETVRQVLEREPRRLTTLRPGLDRDLETICLKCLEKDPPRRYASAEALAADLERWQRHEPVSARPPSAVYVLKKMVRRNKGGTAALGTIVLLLVAGVVFSSWQAGVQRTLRGQAEANERAAQEARRDATHESEQRRHQLARLHVAAGNKLVDDGNAFTGLLEFVEALRLDEGDPAREDLHRRRLGAVLRTTPRLKQLWTDIGNLASARFHPDGTRVACGVNGGAVQIFSIERASAVIVSIPNEPPVQRTWFTRDGRYLVTANKGGQIRHWDAATGQPVGPLLSTFVDTITGRSHSEAVDYSRDGRRLIAIVEGGVRFLEVPSGEPAGPLLEIPGRVRRVRFAPDGLSASICGDNPALQIVEVPTGRQIWRLPGPTKPVHHSAFSPDGHLLATVSGPSFAQDIDVWDLDRGERVMETIRGQPAPYDLQFSPEGEWIAVGTPSDLRVYDATTGHRIGEWMRHDSHVTQFEFSSDGKQLASSSVDRTARVWNPATGEPLVPVMRHESDLYETRLSPGGDHLLTTCADATRLWELRPNNGARVSWARLESPPAVRPSPDGQNVAELSGAGTVRISNIRSGLVSSFWHEAGSTAGNFSHDGARFFAAENSGVVRCREVATGKELFTVQHPGIVRRVAPCPDGRQFLTAGDDATVRLWNTVDGAPMAPALVHGGPVLHAVFSRDGRWIVTGGRELCARIWDAPSGALIGSPLELRSPILSVAINADRTRILTIRKPITGGTNGTLFGATQLWDAAAQAPLGPEWPLLSPFHCPAVFSPDGRRFLKLPDLTTVEVCDAQTGQRAAPPIEHRELPTGFAFSPDGRMILTQAGRVVRVWDAQTSEPISPPLLHNNGVVSADWTADSREFVTNENDGRIRVWDMSPVSASVAELGQLAELLAARRRDPHTGAVPLTPAEIQSRWHAIRRTFDPVSEHGAQ